MHAQKEVQMPLLIEAVIKTRSNLADHEQRASGDPGAISASVLFRVQG